MVADARKPTKMTVIVKPTNACNLGCEYCYADSGEGAFMNEVTLENMLTKVAKHQGKDNIASFLWHGGEPLLMGIDFYKRVIRITRELEEEGLHIQHSMQTNGTLLTRRFASLLVENNFSIGLSLDGPKHINDLTRHYKDGSSSFDDTLKAHEILKSLGRNGGVVTVISKANLDKIDEVYKFFKESKIPFKANPIFKVGRAEQREDLGLSPGEYSRAVLSLFEKFYYDSNPVETDTIIDTIVELITGGPVACHHLPTCQEGFIGMDALGDVYTCGRFVGSKEFKYGNINENSFEEILASPIRQEILKRRDLEVCKPCEYNKMCHSGCMNNAFITYGNIHNKDSFCADYKIIYKRIDDVIMKDLEAAEVKREVVKCQ